LDFYWPINVSPEDSVDLHGNTYTVTSSITCARNSSLATEVWDDDGGIRDSDYRTSNWRTFISRASVWRVSVGRDWTTSSRRAKSWL
jgi:hypothetical protein